MQKRPDARNADKIRKRHIPVGKGNSRFIKGETENIQNIPKVRFLIKGPVGDWWHTLKAKNFRWDQTLYGWVKEYPINDPMNAPRWEQLLKAVYGPPHKPGVECHYSEVQDA